ncbi:hypothetical protein [Nonomuraea sp. NPDC049141]|uniref:hypothetical protein n=1 Tax=Nonomuraea sp. NPDC049141 TaxID=3155500 RepID=UPI0033F97CF4
MEDDDEARRLLYDVQGAYARLQQSPADLDGMLKAVIRVKRQARFAAWSLRKLRRRRKRAAREAARGS